MPLSQRCSSSNPPLTRTLSDPNFSGNLPEPNRGLTRQRKLRYLSNQDIGRYFPELPSSCSLPSSPPSGYNHLSPVAVPHPLPLPTAASISSQAPARKNGEHVTKSSSRFFRNFQKRFNFQMGLNIPAKTLASDFSSLSASPQRSKTTNLYHLHVAPNSARCSNDCNRRRSQDLNVERSRPNITVNVSTRSAPTSVLSSPAVSPRRSRIRERFSSIGGPQEFQDGLTSRSPILLPEKSKHSLDRSPLLSPTARSPRFNHTSPNGIVFPSNHKLPVENSAERPESNNSHFNAHPLPLPPGPKIFHIMEKPYAPSMRDQWQKGKLIGRGTFGSVYLATNRETGALCAMKEVDLIPDDPKSAECIKQLEQEINVLRQLKHPNIVQYYGSEITDDHFYIYLEYVYPGAINRFVREHCEAITESVVRNFTHHILVGLAYLHDMKTIHRDIKGANLLVDTSGVVKLADFGMAKHLTGLYDLSLKGSPNWMAPEVIKAALQRETDTNLALAVDIWSLGCTIIEMLNGKPPWSEFEGPSVMFKALNKTPPIPETLSSEGKDFLLRCFRRNPAERPSAVTLLEHPFVQNVSVSPHSFSAMNLT